MNGEQFIQPGLLEKADKRNESIKRLFRSIHTIDTYRDRMMLKPETSNTAALVKIAVKPELVTL